MAMLCALKLCVSLNVCYFALLHKYLITFALRILTELNCRFVRKIWCTKMSVSFFHPYCRRIFFFFYHKNGENAFAAVRCCFAVWNLQSVWWLLGQVQRAMWKDDKCQQQERNANENLNGWSGAATKLQLNKECRPDVNDMPYICEAIATI